MTTENALKKIVEICESGEIVTLATDIKGFYWFAKGKLSPYGKYVYPESVEFEDEFSDSELCKALIDEDLKLTLSGCAGFYYFSKE